MNLTIHVMQKKEMTKKNKGMKTGQLADDQQPRKKGKKKMDSPFLKNLWEDFKSKKVYALVSNEDQGAAKELITYMGTMMDPLQRHNVPVKPKSLQKVWNRGFVPGALQFLFGRKNAAIQRASEHMGILKKERSGFPMAESVNEISASLGSDQETDLEHEESTVDGLESDQESAYDTLELVPNVSEDSSHIEENENTESLKKEASLDIEEKSPSEPTGDETEDESEESNNETKESGEIDSDSSSNVLIVNTPLNLAEQESHQETVYSSAPITLTVEEKTRSRITIPKSETSQLSLYTDSVEDDELGFSTGGPVALDVDTKIAKHFPSASISKEPTLHDSMISISKSDTPQSPGISKRSTLIPETVENTRSPLNSESAMDPSFIPSQEKRPREDETLSIGQLPPSDHIHAKKLRMFDEPDRNTNTETDHFSPEAESQNEGNDFNNSIPTSLSVKPVKESIQTFSSKSIEELRAQVEQSRQRGRKFSPQATSLPADDSLIKEKQGSPTMNRTLTESGQSEPPISSVSEPPIKKIETALDSNEEGEVCEENETREEDDVDHRDHFQGIQDIRDFDDRPSNYRSHYTRRERPSTSRERKFRSAFSEENIEYTENRVGFPSHDVRRESTGQGQNFSLYSMSNPYLGVSSGSQAQASSYSNTTMMIDPSVIAKAQLLAALVQQPQAQNGIQSMSQPSFPQQSGIPSQYYQQQPSSYQQQSGFPNQNYHPSQQYPSMSHSGFQQQSQTGFGSGQGSGRMQQQYGHQYATQNGMGYPQSQQPYYMPQEGIVPAHGGFPSSHQQQQQPYTNSYHQQPPYYGSYHQQSPYHSTHNNYPSSTSTYPSFLETRRRDHR